MKNIEIEGLQQSVRKPTIIEFEKVEVFEKPLPPDASITLFDEVALALEENRATLIRIGIGEAVRWFIEVVKK